MDAKEIQESSEASGGGNSKLKATIKRKNKQFKWSMGLKARLRLRQDECRNELRRGIGAERIIKSEIVLLSVILLVSLSILPKASTKQHIEQVQHQHPNQAQADAQISKVNQENVSADQALKNHRHHHNKHNKNKPDGPSSSSSFFAPIEDLNDSTIKTKLGVIRPALTQEAILEEFESNKPKGPARTQDQMHQDFDQLLERILVPLESQQQLNFPSQSQHIFPEPSGGYATTVSADANNKTTMRFFRNSKTFGSIVYMNSDGKFGKGRRLINCHLVDLERHASDVALFEAKYDIKTIDIDFRDMMRLIDACTDIARFRTQTKTAISTPGVRGGGSDNHSIGSGAPVNPLYVVGRPLPSLTQPSLVAQVSPKHREDYQRIMTGALSQELSKLGPTIDDSPRLDLPETNFQDQSNGTNNEPPASMSGRSLALRMGGITRHVKRWLELPPAAPPPIQSVMVGVSENVGPHQLLNTAISRVNDFAAKRLTLSEVTPAPNALSHRQGSLREAIREISSYDSTDLMAIWRGILPGTNWCGMGDRATSYNDLGFESDIDICCRAHDFCPVRLSAFRSGYGLFNWSFYTRSHCLCDQNFLDCLQRAESPLSAVVMKLYFKIMKTTCLNDNETNTGDASIPSQEKINRR